MRDLPVINYHWAKAYCSACTWAALVIIWLCILLQFTTMLQFSLFSLQVYRHSSLLNLPCRSSQLPCMAEILCLIQSFSCWCFSCIPQFERQLIMFLFSKPYSIAFCMKFTHLKQDLCSYFHFREYIHCSKPCNGACSFFKTILNTQILRKKLSIYPIPLKEVI